MPDRGDISATVVTVVADGAETIVGRVDAGRADLAVIDALVRLQLVARRSGGRVRLRNASEELRTLLELVGLAEVLGGPPATVHPKSATADHRQAASSTT